MAVRGGGRRGAWAVRLQRRKVECCDGQLVSGLEVKCYDGRLAVSVCECKG